MSPLLKRYVKREKREQQKVQRKVQQKGSSESGFTMIEILMTLLLLTVVLLGLTALQVTTIRQTTASQRSTAASRLAQSILEQHQRLPIAAVQALTPKGSWFTLLKKDESNQMVNVAGDGERDGPFTVERMVEPNVSPSGVPHFIITIRVTWLGTMRGNQEVAADQYETQELLMSCRRFL